MMPTYNPNTRKYSTATTNTPSQRYDPTHSETTETRKNLDVATELIHTSQNQEPHQPKTPRTYIMYDDHPLVILTPSPRQ